MSFFVEQVAPKEKSASKYSKSAEALDSRACRFDTQLSGHLQHSPNGGVTMLFGPPWRPPGAASSGGPPGRCETITNLRPWFSMLWGPEER